MSNPALDGQQPPGADATASQLDSNGIGPGQDGINAASAASLMSVARNFYSQAERMGFIKTKANKLTYGMALSFEGVLGLKSTIIAGMKTAIDAAFNRTHNLSGYRTAFCGLRYEIIRSKKVETVYGYKEDVAVGGKKYEWSNGAWTHKETGIKKQMQKDFEAICKSLAEEFGTKLEETTQKHTSRITKYEEDVKTETSKYVTSLQVKAGNLRATISEMKRDIKKIDEICNEFTRKTSSMEAAADSALNIQTPKSKIKGSMIQIKGSVQKFMGDLVKLGE
jgi:Uncharacterized conserved protein